MYKPPKTTNTVNVTADPAKMYLKFPSSDIFDPKNPISSSFSFDSESFPEDIWIKPILHHLSSSLFRFDVQIKQVQDQELKRYFY